MPRSRSIVNDLLQFVVIMLLGLTVLNAGYRFDGTFRRLGDYHFHSQSLTTGESDNRFRDTVWAGVPVPFPAELIQGIDTQRVDFERGIDSYLLGKHSDHGWWYYCLIVLVLKEPLGMILLAMVAGFCFLRATMRSNWQTEFLIVAWGGTLLVVVSAQTGFSLHGRYILPLLPLLFLWISRVGRLFEGRATLAVTGLRALVVTLLVWNKAFP